MLTAIAIASYGVAALAFVLLSILLLTSWRKRSHGMALGVVCLLSMFWAIATTVSLLYQNSLLLLVDVLELLRDTAWIAFFALLLGYLRITRSFVIVPIGTVAWLASFSLLVLLCFTIYLHNASTSRVGDFGFFVFVVSRAILALLAVLLIEQFYRGTPKESRWGIKFICLGVGGLFIYDFYLYSHAMLFHRIDVEIWSARGVANALVVPLIALSAARNPKWSIDISVSRSILMHSVTIISAAAYLLMMAAAGYVIRYFGGSLGALLQVVFLFVAVVVFVALLFSGTLRSWLKVFISKNFFSYHYDYREEWLRFTRKLSEGEQALPEKVIQSIAGLVESPAGCLWLCKNSVTCEPVARWNMPLLDISELLSGDLCQFFEQKKWVIDLQEYADNPAKYDGLILPMWLVDMPRAWLIVPLLHQRHLLGFIVLAQPRSKIKLNWEVFDLLDVAGTQAASYLAQQQAANDLMVARQFESFNRMSTFVVHDIKNLVAQLSLLLSNAEKHKNNPEFQKDMMETLDLSVSKMRRMLEKLSSQNTADKVSSLDMSELLQRAVDAKLMAEPKPSLYIADTGLRVRANWASLERVLGHLIQNAIEATVKNGQVSVRLSRKDNTAVVDIQDTGHGMSDEFIRYRLFKPFESTKTAGMGIGVFESQEYVHELGGRMEVTSTPGLGTLFRVILPLSE